ncbi:MAG: hypothetical protein M1813_001347 [Trichoglossum hirsutum]|nr:MAG: hypothetical protein M1813_001347 [Trichoglossum hirsutum]
MAENLASQVSILEKKNRDQASILDKRRTKQSGKRMAIKGHFILSTKEILDKLIEAEEETACKKTTRNTRKRLETPSEDEESSYDSDSDSSDSSDYIVVGRC